MSSNPGPKRTSFNPDAAPFVPSPEFRPLINDHLMDEDAGSTDLAGPHVLETGPHANMNNPCICFVTGFSSDIEESKLLQMMESLAPVTALKILLKRRVQTTTEVPPQNITEAREGWHQLDVALVVFPRLRDAVRLVNLRYFLFGQRVLEIFPVLDYDFVPSADDSLLVSGLPPEADEPQIRAGLRNYRPRNVRILHESGPRSSLRQRHRGLAMIRLAERKVAAEMARRRLWEWDDNLLTIRSVSAERARAPEKRQTLMNNHLEMVNLIKSDSASNSEMPFVISTENSGMPFNYQAESQSAMPANNQASYNPGMPSSNQARADSRLTCEIANTDSGRSSRRGSYSGCESPGPSPTLPAETHEPVFRSELNATAPEFRVGATHGHPIWHEEQFQNQVPVQPFIPHQPSNVPSNETRFGLNIFTDPNSHQQPQNITPQNINPPQLQPQSLELQPPNLDLQQIQNSDMQQPQPTYVDMPLPQNPNVNMPLSQNPNVNMPFPQYPNVNMPLPQNPNIDMPLPPNPNVDMPQPQTVYLPQTQYLVYLQNVEPYRIAVPLVPIPPQ